MKEFILYALLVAVAALVGVSMYMARDRGLIAMMLAGFMLYVVPILLISKKIGLVEAVKIVTRQLIEMVDPRIAIFVVAALLGYYLGIRRGGGRRKRRRSEEVVFVVE